jgi:hypothetical protein
MEAVRAVAAQVEAAAGRKVERWEAETALAAVLAGEREAKEREARMEAGVATRVVVTAMPKAVAKAKAGEMDQAEAGGEAVMVAVVLLLAGEGAARVVGWEPAGTDEVRVVVVVLRLAGEGAARVEAVALRLAAVRALVLMAVLLQGVVMVVVAALEAVKAVRV